MVGPVLSKAPPGWSCPTLETAMPPSIASENADSLRRSRLRQKVRSPQAENVDENLCVRFVGRLAVKRKRTRLTGSRIDVPLTPRQRHILSAASHVDVSCKARNEEQRERPTRSHHNTHGQCGPSWLFHNFPDRNQKSHVHVRSQGSLFGFSRGCLAHVI